MFTRRAILAGSMGATALGVAGATAGAAPANAYNAMDYGVRPNAPHDQTGALQAAIDGANANGGYLILPPGRYVARNLSISAPFCLQGMPGLTHLILAGGAHLLQAGNTHNVTLSGIIFDGARQPVSQALVVFDQVDNLTIEQCEFRNSVANSLSVRRSSGRVMNNTLAHAVAAAIFAIDSRGLEICNNHVHDMADNGILVWQSKPREDGTIISHNRIERIGNKSGGSGQYGNGINIFRAGSVTASNNRICDCAYTAIRNHSGSNVQMLANNCSRLGEVALYSEFGFEGAVISDNVVDDAATGISITNFNDGGRLAVCANNLVRRLHVRDHPDKRGIGISVEADTVVTGNVIEDAPVAGLALGWGPYSRNISAIGNIVRSCGVGITASVSRRAEQSLIAHNIISGISGAAILGMDHSRPATADLALPGAEIPSTLTISDNLIS